MYTVKYMTFSLVYGYPITEQNWGSVNNKKKREMAARSTLFNFKRNVSSIPLCILLSMQAGTGRHVQLLCNKVSFRKLTFS